MEKTKKEAKSELLAFFTGGAKLHASTTHTKEELEKMISEGAESRKSIVIDTVNEDPAIANDSLIFLFDKLLFASVVVKAEPTKIIQLDKKIEVVS